MRIAIIGANKNIASKNQLDFAYDLGKTLVDNGYDLINGGMSGVMEYTAKGARASDKFNRGSLIAFLPSTDVSKGNEYTGIKLVTHLGYGRNRLIIMNSDVVVAIGGGAGTLNEITLAWEMGKKICAYTEGNGWSTKMAGITIDIRRDDKIHPVSNVLDVLNFIDSI